MRLNPGALIPPVHDFTADRSFKSELINQTKEMLQDFLDAVLRHPLFGCFELVYYFLHYPDNNKKADIFPKKLRSYSTIAMPMQIEDMKTENGEAKISVTKETVDYVNNISTITSKLKESFQE